jgi:catechol 2,3-dioxygenase
MSTDTPIDPSLQIRSARLAVGDLSRSVDFYERVLGLPLISREHDSALLGGDREHPALELTAIAQPAPASPHNTGLFHVAWLHPSRADLAATIKRIVSGRWPIDGASDHGVSEALYLSDPDGLGIEIYVDRPLEQWDRPADGQGVKMVTLPLDLDDLIAQAPLQPSAAVAPGTYIGHVHMKVSDVPRALAFYRDVLGMQEQARLPSAAFVSAGGYHHHVGLNSWQSAGQDAAGANAPGLRGIELELADQQALDALAGATAGAREADSGGRAAEGALSLRDPDGQLLTFRAR